MMTVLSSELLFVDKNISFDKIYRRVCYQEIFVEMLAFDVDKLDGQSFVAAVSVDELENVEKQDVEDNSLVGAKEEELVETLGLPRSNYCLKEVEA